MFDVETIRKDFPILERVIWEDKPLVYLDNAATTQKPKVVINALKDYYEKHNANIHRGVHKLAEEATIAYEDVRGMVKAFVNASDNESVIYTRNTTESINLLSYSLEEKFISSGDEIIVSKMEHHSNIIPWFRLKDKIGCEVKFIPLKEDDTLNYEALEEMISPKTKIISIVHKSNVLGTTNDVKRIAKLAKEKNIISIIDAAQSAPHMKLDFQDIGCDFLAFSAHKMCGPTGVGVLVGRNELLEKMSPFMGGGEMIRMVTFDGYTTNDLPYKFVAGAAYLAEVFAFGEAIKYVQNVGLENIHKHEADLTEYAINRLKEFEFLKIFGPEDVNNRAGIITFKNPVVHPHDVATIVDQYGVAVRAGHHCAQPLMRELGVPSTTRASFYFYNTFKEVDKLVEALQKAYEYFQLGACKELK